MLAAAAAARLLVGDYAVSVFIWVGPAPEKQSEKAGAYQQFGKQSPN